MFRKPWTNGASAYHEVDTYQDIIDGFKRCRTQQAFIMTDNGIRANAPTCNYCGKPITVHDGNRGRYFPKYKKFIIEHYKCAWDNLLGIIYGKFYDAIM